MKSKLVVLVALIAMLSMGCAYLKEIEKTLFPKKTHSVKRISPEKVKPISPAKETAQPPEPKYTYTVTPDTPDTAPPPPAEITADRRSYKSDPPKRHWKKRSRPTGTRKQAKKKGSTPPRKPKNYTVVKGDTLQKISKKVYGTTKKWIALYKANQKAIKNPNRIFPGQKLVIP